MFGTLYILYKLARNMVWYEIMSKDMDNRLNSNHRVGIECKSPYKESYTVNSHWKTFDYVFSDVRACVRFQN